MCPTDVLAINGVPVDALGSAGVIVSFAADTSCEVLSVVLNDVLFERSLLANNAGDELSTSALLEIALIDSALVTEAVVFSDFLDVGEMLDCRDWLENLSWLVTAVTLLGRYSTELGIEVTGLVGISVTGVVRTIVETGKLDVPCVVETLATDRLGLLSGEVVMLSLILLLEVRTIVCDTFGVNAEKSSVVLVDLVDLVEVGVSTTKVLVSTGSDKFVLTLEV